MDGHVVAYRTPFVSTACNAYRELFSWMNSGTAISSLDYPGVSVKATGLVMKTVEDKGGKLVHEIEACGALASRRQYPQKPTSGLIDEE